MAAPVLLTFAAVFAGVLALFFAVTAARQSPAAEARRRLQRMVEGGPSEPIVQDLLREKKRARQIYHRLPLMAPLAKFIERSGVQISAPQLVGLSVTACAVSFLLVLAVRQNIVAALITAVAVAMIPVSYLKYQKQQRETRFIEQLPDALTMISRSLRAGHSLAGAVELVGQELPEPTGGLFRMAYEQQQLGMRMADSLRTLLGKIDSMDLHFFVTIIRINSETGGNLAEIMDKLADTIRSRLQIRRQVQVCTAEGRMSGYVLVIIPVAVFILFYMMRPEYMEVFFTDRGCQLMLLAAGVAQLIGFLFIRKIINIRI